MKKYKSSSGNRGQKNAAKEKEKEERDSLQSLKPEDNKSSGINYQSLTQERVIVSLVGVLLLKGILFYT
ncbi:hypothetical protein [Peribacillus frigoritolerans]|uniref:hypothetical protein n=1 Tax=Peribacillus frigoritolerans TaxID=450367 RepID=UPI00207A2EC8|nr:hypothetical protein [Peribacillus frigoritolerans]USK63496.1 hypothetical protein LIT26_20025 [Peribacillus frigoritolerans]